MAFARTVPAVAVWGNCYCEDFTEPETALGSAARPASNLATGTRKGEHDT